LEIAQDFTLSVTQARLSEFLKEHRQRASNRNGEVSANPRGLSGAKAVTAKFV
jgi:hypothetical protein